MNDFLKKIRPVQKPSRQRKSGITRKTYDSRNSQLKEKRHIIDRRSNMEQMEKTSKQFSEFIEDSIPVIKDNLARIASSMEKIADTKEIISKETIKEHREIGKFFKNLNTILVQEIIPALDKNMDQNIDSTKENDKSYKKSKSFYFNGNNTKEEVLNIIKTMRKKGSTFAAIADYLKDRGIPTFSGRGKWHAQTIHRLYK